MIQMKIDGIVSIDYNMLRNAPRHTKGKIGEMVFKKIYQHYFKDFLCCYSMDLRHFLFGFVTFARRFNIDLNKFVEKFDEKVLDGEIANAAKMLREYADFGDGEIDASFMAKNISQICPFCLKKPEDDKVIKLHFYSCDDIAIPVCEKCYKHLVEKGYAEAIESGEASAFEVLSWGLYQSFHLLLDMISCQEVMKFLSRLSREDREFVEETLRSKYWNSFDFLCIDSKNNKYVVDVKSVIESPWPGPLSQREKEFASIAKRRGFKPLIVVLWFFSNSSIRVEVKNI